MVRPVHREWCVHVRGWMGALPQRIDQLWAADGAAVLCTALLRLVRRPLQERRGSRCRTLRLGRAAETLGRPRPRRGPHEELPDDFTHAAYATHGGEVGKSSGREGQEEQSIRRVRL